MWGYTIGNCKDCHKSIHIDEPYQKLGEFPLVDGIICEDCITERKLKEIKDYITDCEDVNGYVFDNKSESLLYDALKIINDLNSCKDVLSEVFDEMVELKDVQIQDLTVMVRGLKRENKMLSECNEHLEKTCKRRAKKIFLLEKALREETEENEKLREITDIVECIGKVIKGDE